MTMLSNETVRKLHEMRLGVMAEAFSTQLEDSAVPDRCPLRTALPCW